VASRSRSSRTAITLLTSCPRVSWGRLRETIEVLSDAELVRELREGLTDVRAGRVFPAEQVAADLAARRAAGQ